MGYPPMGDSAICLPWDKTENSLQRVMAGGVTKIHKRVQRYPSKSLPSGTDTGHGIPLLNVIVQWSHSFCLSSYSCHRR